MSSFTNTTAQVLVAGALVLGAGIYYQSYASQRLEDARAALRSVDAAQAKAQTTKRRAEEYVRLIATMADRKIERQQPFAVTSEFSPQEISQVGELLGTLYQRGGYFFLKHFQVAWKDADAKLGLLPRVAVDLQGRKVLMFSDELAAASSVASVKR